MQVVRRRDDRPIGLSAGQQGIEVTVMRDAQLQRDLAGAGSGIDDRGERAVRRLADTIDMRSPDRPGTDDGDLQLRWHGANSRDAATHATESIRAARTGSS